MPVVAVQQPTADLELTHVKPILQERGSSA